MVLLFQQQCPNWLFSDFLIDRVSVSRDFVCVPAKQYVSCMHDHIAKLLECTFPRNQIIYSCIIHVFTENTTNPCPISKFSILFFFSILFSFGQHIIIPYQVQGLFQTLVLSILALNLCTYVKKIQYYRIVTVTYIHTLRDIISDKGELGSEWQL